MKFHSKRPIVSVIMSVYNNQKYLKEAIESILRQSFIDFEFIIINDGSKDNISKIVKKHTDTRIKFVDFEENEGLIKRLNYGLSVAEGKYIAIMDSDDIASPNRLEKEVNFLENNADYGMCSGFCQKINPDGDILDVNKQISDANEKFEPEISHERAKIQLMFTCRVSHATVMLRKEILETYFLKYNEEFPHCEDYKMWYEISKITRMGVIPEILLKYRVHNNQVSNTFHKIQRRSFLNIMKEQLRAIGIYGFDDKRQEMHIHFVLGNPFQLDTFEPDYIIKVQAWLNKIKNGNLKYKVYDPLILDDYLNELYKKVKRQWEYIKPNRFCNLCKSNFDAFNFIDSDFVKKWDSYQYIHSIFCLETFNMLEYECPNCRAIDIERLSILYFEEKIKTLKSKVKVLNLSQSTVLNNYFISKSSFIEYSDKEFTAILQNNKNDEGCKKVEAGSVEVVFCLNVLQKLNDDLAAIKELYKMLKPGGYGIVMVPIQLNLVQNYEHDNISDDDGRWTHFGHSSHKRLYSKHGFLTNLKSEGLDVESFDIDHFDPASFKKFGIHPRSVLYVVKKLDMMN